MIFGLLSALNTSVFRRIVAEELTPQRNALTAMNTKLQELLTLAQANNAANKTISEDITKTLKDKDAKLTAALATIDDLQVKLANTPPDETETITALTAELVAAQNFSNQMLAKLEPPSPAQPGPAATTQTQ